MVSSPPLARPPPPPPGQSGSARRRQPQLATRESISGQINLAVGLAVALGLGLMILLFAHRQQDSIIAQHRRAMLEIVESTGSMLQTIMLAGYADIAKEFADRLKTIPGVVDFVVLRSDGREAFRDDATIDRVERRLGTTDPFHHHAARLPATPPLPADLAAIDSALADHGITTISGADADGHGLMSFIVPIVNQPACHGCHGDDHAIRGFLKLTTSLALPESAVRSTWAQALLMLAGSLAVIAAGTAWLLNRVVVAPLGRVAAAMSLVAEGNLNQRVPEIGGDELSLLARSFNRMAADLVTSFDGYQAEQEHLLTIILTALEGMVVTDGERRIVLVNPAAERLLGKSAGAIIEDGLFALLDDPLRMQRWLDDPAMATAGETLACGAILLEVRVATIGAADGSIIGSAVMLRDVTEERRLEDRLRTLSSTDPLTGLGNRRLLDQALGREIQRALGRDLDLAVMILDVDRFKRVNDTYGHDRGDVVLAELATVIRAAVREVDLPCRFGGEEFVVLLPGTDGPGALALAERLRAAVEATRLGRLPITISLGVASLRDIAPAAPDTLLEAADRALYAAKRAGRNRVMAARAEAATA